jgi:BatD DUF11 like domain
MGLFGMRKFLWVFLLLLTGMVKGNAQALLTTEAGERKIGVEDLLEVSYIVKDGSRITKFTPPVFRNFRTVSGPNEKRGVVISGNQVQNNFSIGYILKPVKTGRLSLPGANATIDGKEVRSNSITVEVVAGSLGNSAGTGFGFQPIQREEPLPDLDFSKEAILKPGENIEAKIRANLFVRIETDKQECYEGESVVVAYKFYTRLVNTPRISKMPSLNGFSVVDMTESDNFERGSLDGRYYNVFTIRKAQLFPLQTGNIELEPVVLDNKIRFIQEQFLKQRTGGNILNEYMVELLKDPNNKEGIVEQELTIESKPLSVLVKPLPVNGKPEGFSGAVGDFSIIASLDKNTIPANDAATLRITISGKGNLPVITAPVIPWPAGYETFDPTVKDALDRMTIPLSGAKTFEYVFTPTKKGSDTIAPVRFSYFDLASGTYKTISTNPIAIEVGDAIKNDPENNNTSGKIGQANDFFPKNKWKIAIALAIALLAGLVAFFATRRKKLPGSKANIALAAEAPMVINFKEAGTAAETDSAKKADAHPSFAGNTNLFAKAEALLVYNDTGAFYRELNSVTWGYAADKLGIAQTALNKQSVAEKLQAMQVDETAYQLFHEVSSECEMALYSPVVSLHDMKESLEKAKRFVEIVSLMS